jgi:type IV pilus assembly protein PilM
MGLPFVDSLNGKKRDQVMAVDLGGRTTKAVEVHRSGHGLALGGYAVLDAPIFEKTISPELLTEHLKAVVQALPVKAKNTILTMGVNDALVRHADMPRVAIGDLRLALKLNARTYLQQELPGYAFDCYLGATQQQPMTADRAKQPPGSPKQRVLIAGAKKQLLDDYVRGGRGAGLIVDYIVPSLICPVNSFEMAMPEVFAKEAVALVDLGFKNSSICILQQGELILSRVVSLGGDRLTSGLAEVLNVSYAEAEGIKIGMPTEVQAQLESLVMPLGRELRASIDFYEHEHDRPVTQVFITGAAARSDFIVQTLEHEMIIGCKALNPTTFLQMEPLSKQTAEIEQVAPQLAVAVGAALVVL